MSEPPLPSTRRRMLLAKYGPLLTTPFYFGFSTHALVPNLFAKAFGPTADGLLTNVFWFGSQIGVGIYLYTTKHLRNADLFQRIAYSFFGSTMFNVGNVLVMSILRSIFPDNAGIRLLVGLSTSAALLIIGKRYVNYIDQIFDTVRFRPFRHW